MPYIKREDREAIDIGLTPRTAGELNYLITKLCTKYISRTGIRYNTYNEVIGVLECAKQEPYRRAVAPYEDKKIQENGDVY